MPDDFVAADLSPLVGGLFCRLLPALLPRLGVVGVDYDASDLARVRALAGQRVLLVPNHPTNTEPAILFDLGCRTGQPFHFLACREAFEPLWGLWGQVIRRVGAFSVVRGTADRASFRATRDSLARPGSKLVVFPEGEVYSQNDTLLPFNAGIFQLAFWALDDLHKAGANDAALYVLPVAVKYRFVRDMMPAIRASLVRLERFNGLSPDGANDVYVRLRRIGLTMLCSVEREYRLPTPAGDDHEADLTPRMTAIKEAILQRVATAAGLPLPKGDTLPDRMRALIHHVEEVTEGEPERRGAASPYERALRREQRERARPLLRDLKRLANYVALTDNYVRADPTPERMADTLQRLERESFGRALLDGPRRCCVRVGEPINLAARYNDYQKARRAEIVRVTHEVESQVLALLRLEAAAPTPRA